MGISVMLGSVAAASTTCTGRKLRSPTRFASRIMVARTSRRPVPSRTEPSSVTESPTSIERVLPCIVSWVVSPSMSYVVVVPGAPTRHPSR